MLMLRFCWCYTTHISTQQQQGTRYAALCDMKMLRHMNMLRSMTMLRNMKMLRYMTFLLMFYFVSLRFHTWTYVNSSRCVHCKKNPEEQGESQDPHGWRRWLLEGPQANHPWKFAIEKGPGAQSSNMEMHALFPVAVGVHRENLMEATAEALKKMWEKLRLPFLRLEWWKGCHSKSRRFFFDRFRMLISGSSLWGRRNFDHFLAPVTLPAGCFGRCSCRPHVQSGRHACLDVPQVWSEGASR